MRKANLPATLALIIHIAVKVLLLAPRAGVVNGPNTKVAHLNPNV
jgi:hypothetical protein